MPANFLLLPESWQDSADYQNLLNGILPKEDLFYKFALEGEIEKALAELIDGSFGTKFNRFILNSSPELYLQLKQELTDEYAKLLDVAAFTLNYISEPPTTENLEGEMLAFVLMANATHKIEQGEIETAISLLKEASETAKPISTMLYGQILTSLAETQHQFFGANANVVQTYKNAIEVLKKSELELTKASLQMNLGICYQEISTGNRGALLEAVKCYQEALKFFTRENFPEEFAFAQNNLALAYLSMPMTEASDQLRVAIAIQALREALKVYKKETHSELWASTQLNLANALQYAPTSHPEENLQEAVNLYEEILSVRQPTQNPVGYARLLANQGNALAHLGIFNHAIPKLNEAMNIFNQIEDTGSADSIKEILDEIEANQTAAATN
ncbi:MAG TPA: tetratricopeptide repeat protein [Pyrinomonadaceae bacterium]|nr:tetratricopeptide repeat protein [Pyrinomonadaceae bacterium]